jgi:hypothetical protein
VADEKLAKAVLDLSRDPLQAAEQEIRRDTKAELGPGEKRAVAKLGARIVEFFARFVK